MSHQLGSRTPWRDTYVGFCQYNEDEEEERDDIGGDGQGLRHYICGVTLNQIGAITFTHFGAMTSTHGLVQ